MTATVPKVYDKRIKSSSFGCFFLPFSKPNFPYFRSIIILGGHPISRANVVINNLRVRFMYY